MKRFMFVITIFLLVFFIGCSNKTTIGEKTANQALPSNIAATVNGENITLTDFQRRLHKLAFVLKAKGQPIPGETKEAQLNYLQALVMKELVQEKMILQAAKNEGTLPREAELQQILNDIKKGFPSEEAFKSIMESRGLNEENIINYNRIQLIKQRLGHKLGSPEAVGNYVDNLIKQAKIKTNDAVITPLLEQQL